MDSLPKRNLTKKRPSVSPIGRPLAMAFMRFQDGLDADC